MIDKGHDTPPLTFIPFLQYSFFPERPSCCFFSSLQNHSMQLRPRILTLVWELLLFGQLDRLNTVWADGADIDLNKANIHSGKWSWVVALMSDISSTTRNHATPYEVNEVSWSHQHFCGGSVLNQYWVLTASHCFDSQAGGNDPATWKVRFSDDGFKAHKFSTGWKIHSGLLASRARALGVSEIVRHPRYNRTNVDADIALIRLKSAISTLSPTHKIALAPLPYHENITFQMGTHCVTIGWKCPPFVRQHSSCVAYVVPMPINDVDMCTVYSIKDWSDKLCAGKINAHVGVCGGDSGDALVCEAHHDGEKVMAGFLSFVHKDTPFSVPSGYTAVKPYLKWILETISQSE